MTQQPTTRTIGDRASINRKMHGLLPHTILSEMARIKFGVASMTELDDREFEDLYRHVVKVAPKRQRPTTNNKRPKRPWSAPASKAQINYINDLRHKISGLDNHSTFNMWMVRSLRIFKKAPDFEKLKNGEAYKIIEALKSMRGRSQMEENK